MIRPVQQLYRVDRHDNILGIKILVQTFIRIGVTLLLAFLQLLIFPDGHMVRPSSPVWAGLWCVSALIYLLLSPLVAFVPHQEPLRFLWRAAFVVYCGTTGSALFTAADIVFYIALCSWPIVLLRYLCQPATEAPKGLEELGPAPLQSRGKST